MRNILGIVVLSLFATSCATFGSNPGFVAFGACTTQNLETAGKNLINDISAVFSTAGYEAEIAKLIAEVGNDEVQCGIDLFVSQASQKKSLTKVGATALENAKAYRAAHPNG